MGVWQVYEMLSIFLWAYLSFIYFLLWNLCLNIVLILKIVLSALVSCKSSLNIPDANFSFFFLNIRYMFYESFFPSPYLYNSVKL